MSSLRLVGAADHLSCTANSYLAIAKYLYTLSIVEAGRERWADVSEDDKGSSFRFTFARNVKVHLVRTSRHSSVLLHTRADSCLSVLQSHSKLPTGRPPRPRRRRRSASPRSKTTPRKSWRCAAALFEVESCWDIADFLFRLQDCVTNRLPDAPVMHLAFQVGFVRRLLASATPVLTQIYAHRFTPSSTQARQSDSASVSARAISRTPSRTVQRSTITHRWLQRLPRCVSSTLSLPRKPLSSPASLRLRRYLGGHNAAS